MRPIRVLPYLAFSLLLFAAGAGRAQPAPSDSLQHYWTLDASSGTTAADSAGGLAGTLAGGPVWRPALGRFGGALEFDGVDDRVELAGADVDPGPGMTLALWMRADDFGVSDGRLISKATGTAEQSHYWMLSTVNSTALRFRLRAGGTTTTLATATGQIQAGEWYHVVATYDGAVMRLYKNGAEVASVAKTGAIATAGAVDAAIGDQPAGAGSKPFDGLIDDVRIYNRALTPAEVAGMVPPPPPPAITLFHGDVVDWGHLGTPQTWVDIQGRIQGYDRVDSLYYRVDGGALSELNMGPDGFRLVDPGDFTVEIDHGTLSVGPHDVVITAVDTLGQRSDTTVTVNYTGGVTWPLPDTLAFTSASSISEESYIIDGAWRLVPGGVRTDSTATGYDRLLVAGESTWKTNYEVIVPVTIHGFESTFPDNGPAIGVGVGWTGHTGSGQPRLGHPYQSIGFIRGLHSSPYLQLMRDGDVGVVTTPATILLDTRYMMRLRSDSTSATTSRVKLRVWEDGTPEPAGWNLEADFTTRDGSVLLIAHRADVTFGDAVIQPLEHVLQVATVGDGSVARVPDLARYPDSTTVELTATPAPGWTFDSWSGGLAGSVNPDTLLLTSSTTVTATFTRDAYVVAVSATGNGTVTRSPDRASYVYGDTVVVTAVPDPGWSFDGWSGGLSGSENPDTIVVASDTSVTAAFVSNPYTVTTGVSGGGAVTRLPDQSTYAAGDTVLLTAEPNPGWIFDFWSGGLSGSANPDTVVVVSDTSVTANFAAQSYTLTRSATGMGSVQVNPNLASYAYGDTLVFTAVPSPGWVFAGWTEGLSGSQTPDTLVIVSDTTVTALFTEVQYTVSVAVEGGGVVTRAPDQTAYAMGDTVVLAAIPDTNWTFVEWTGGLSGAANPDTIVVVSDTSVTAVFEQTAFVITRAVAGGGSILLQPDSAAYAAGDTVIATALPDTGWVFDSWSGGLSGSENPDTIVVASDTAIVATFTAVPYTITTSVAGGGQIVLSPDSASYVFGDTVIATAIADAGWVFDSWSGGLSGGENPDTIVVAGDTSFTATFLPKEYVIATSVTGNGTIELTPDLPGYGAGDTVVVAAVPDPGWLFDSWSLGLSGNTNPDTIVVAGDTTVAAVFTPVIVSDDFHYAELDTSIWRWFDPIGDATLAFSGTSAIIDVPGGISHDLWSDCNCAPRLLQAAPDEDFQIEAKFDSRGSRTYQSHGLIVQEDGDTFLRFDVVFWSGTPFLFSAFIDGGSVTTKLNTSVPGDRPYLRVTRSGNTWTFAHSADGTAWTNAGSFTQAMAVSEVGWFALNDQVQETSTPAYVASVDYFFNSAAPITPEDGGQADAPTPPVVVVWHGDDQYAVLGTPQTDHNIVGRVWDVDAVDSLRVTVNGGPPRDLTLGPDGFRLIGVNHFNAEIPYSDLVAGANSIVFTAVDTVGEITNHPVTLNYTPDVAWAMPDTADFTGASRIDDEAYVVDGRWILTGQGARTDSAGTGYDRLLALGDTLWPTDYEVVTPVTIHASDLGAPGGIGVLVGWQGHEGSAQPKLTPPYQTLAFIRKVTTTPELQLLSDGDVIQATTPVPVTLGTRYLLKLRSEAIGGGLSRARAKLWEDGTPEPVGWDVVADFVTRRGSAVLVAHKSDVTFGNTVVTPLKPFPQHRLTVATVGAGAVTRTPAPDSTLGLYPDSSVVRLSAQPDSGWVFDGWSGALAGDANPDSVLLTSDTTVTATFRQRAVLVTAVSGAGTIVVSPDTVDYLVGDTLVVAAVPDTGWSFAGWSGALSGIQNPDTLVLFADTTSIAATFALDAYTVTANVTGSGQVQLSPDSATFAWGDTVIVTAIPDTNWAFTGWSGGLSGAQNPDTIVVVGDTSVTAAFEQVAFTIATGVTGGGSVVLDPDSATYALGDTVVVSAVPDTGWTFVEWTAGLSGSQNPDTLVVAGDSTVTAAFAPAQVTLTRSVAGGGSVLASPDLVSYAPGDTVVVFALASTGWVFESWSGALTGSENPDTLIMQTDTTVTATFTPLGYVITTSVSGSGQIALAPDQATYVIGDTVIATAVPDTGWSFVEWTAGLSGSQNPDTLVVAGDSTVTAAFALAQLTLSREVIGEGSVSASPDFGSYAPGDTVVLSAVAAVGWVFDSWSGALSGSENPDTLVVQTDTTVTATFTPVPYTIDITIVGTGQVTRTPDLAAYVYGDTVILTAVPDTAWVFTGWSGDLTGPENPRTVVVDSSLAITATFGEKPTAAGDGAVPAFAAVGQNFPNPFGRGTTIRYGLPTSERAVLEVYDVRGRLVTRRELPQAAPGWHEYRFDAVDSRGQRLPAGVYFYRLRARELTATRKMIIIR